MGTLLFDKARRRRICELSDRGAGYAVRPATACLRAPRDLAMVLLKDEESHSSSGKMKWFQADPNQADHVRPGGCHAFGHPTPRDRE